MEWIALFPKDNQPGFEDITDYIGGDGKILWISLFEYMDTAYNAKPKMFYSCCSGKPGWNIKFQKSSQSFGTLYPEQGTFSVFIVISYKLDTVMKTIYNNLSSKMRVCYDNAGDYMKMGKWLMFRVENEDDLNDYKLLMTAKMQPKTKP
jgi:hypothetical protein